MCTENSKSILLWILHFGIILLELSAFNMLSYVKEYLVWIRYIKMKIKNIHHILVWRCIPNTFDSFKYKSLYFSWHPCYTSRHAKGYKNNLKQAHRIVTNNVKRLTKFVEDCLKKESLIKICKIDQDVWEYII